MVNDNQGLRKIFNKNDRPKLFLKKSSREADKMQRTVENFKKL